MADIDYRVMRPDDRDEVRELYYAFWRWEPLAVALNMEVPRECKSYVDCAMNQALYNGLSMVAVDKSTGKMVAFGVCVLATPDNDQNWTFPTDDKDCHKMIKEWEILGHLYEGFDLSKLYGVNKIAKVRGFFTDPNYRNQSIGTSFMPNWSRLLEEHGIQLFVAETTSEFSRRIAVKMGSRCLRTTRCDEYEANGTLKIPDDSPHRVMTLVAKRLGLHSQVE